MLANPDDWMAGFGENAVNFQGGGGGGGCPGSPECNQYHPPAPDTPTLPTTCTNCKTRYLLITAAVAVVVWISI